MNIAFNRLEEGYENALKEYNRKQVHLLFDMHLLILAFILFRPKVVFYSRKVRRLCLVGSVRLGSQC